MDTKTAEPPVQKLPHVSITFGADPEFFFAKKMLSGRPGKIIGAEKIIPTDGLNATSYQTHQGRAIIDGVQGELNTIPFTCRESCAHDISQIFTRIKNEIGKKRIAINWNTTVRVTKKELESLKPESRMFGCAPSKNAYDEHIEQPNAEKYLFRSAGGHIHIGWAFNTGTDHVRTLLKDASKDQINKIVKILDIIVGNTCVLVDRDIGNIERRKVYGRAGEYRTPKHGLEYRVLSNFWLKNYQMMSMAYGLVRLAFGFALNKEAEKELFKAIKEEDIRNAINHNDFDLAMSNFKKIEPLIAKYSTATLSLHSGNLKAFNHFVCRGGAKTWFKGDPIKHWATPGGFDVHRIGGWESFLDYRVNNHMMKYGKTPA